MHLAICDDHIADRKQMERLLGRESDRRLKKTGVLYVDSYGSKDSILTAPMIYDAIFMDMTEDGCDAVELAAMLRADGTAIPIIFCSGKVNYRQRGKLPDNVMFLDKPVTAASLSDMIDQLQIINDNQIKKLEFRNLSETFYLKEDDIMYAWPVDGRNMKMHLFNGEERITEMSLDTFCGNLKECDCFIELASHSILNMLYLKEITFFKTTMADGKSFRLSFGESRPLQKAFENYRRNAPGRLAIQ